MEKYRAIPKGYMTVGEIAKKAGVTVRTLQYYDKEGILSPSSESEGGRRLYTDKDIVKLHQIQSIKHLGFSLEDIKTRLPSINTPAEVSSVLIEQAASMREKIKLLKEVLQSLEKLNAEVAKMEVVDWAKYADIIAMLQVKNDSYWILKYLDDTVAGHLHDRYKHKGKGEANKAQTVLNRLMQRAAALQKAGYRPESEKCQALAEDWWDFIKSSTDGDMNMMSKLMKAGLSIDDSEWREKNAFDKEFIGNALGIYLEKTGYSQFEEVQYD
ncbi:MAG: MerR family transcriptional regulator [Oscillospiraceae bacterium]|nr:MerR family transcriptional regulator [Oscillospiraceae bacterium]